MTLTIIFETLLGEVEDPAVRHDVNVVTPSRGQPYGVEKKWSHPHEHRRREDVLSCVVTFRSSETSTRQTFNHQHTLFDTIT